LEIFSNKMILYFVYSICGFLLDFSFLLSDLG
jgi:hypothetical protein